MGLFGGSTKTTQTTDMTNLAKWQTPYVQGAFKDAQALYNSNKCSGWFDGPTYATIDPLTQQAVQGVAGYVNGQGGTAAGNVGLFGNAALGQQQNQFAALQGLNTLANTPATASNIAAASQYASNPYLDQQISAVNRDISRDLTENQLPSLDRQAAASGNVNSSRAGIMEAVLTRGAQDRMADNAATMRSQAYQSGISQAAADRQNNAAILSDLSAQYGNIGSQGLNAAAQGQEMTLQNYSTLDQAGKTLQADQQGQYDAALNAWTQNDQREQGLLNNYFGLIGQSMGQNGKTTSVQQTSTGLIPGLLGAATAGVGLAAKIKAL